MQHPTATQTAQRLTRALICTKCPRRPAGSESLGPLDPRSCEPTCALFVYLPQLQQIAGQNDPVPGDYERSLKDTVCGKCRLSPTAGDYCADYLARSCPLSTYAGEVIGALEGLRAHAGQIEAAPARRIADENRSTTPGG
jgi:hypothetical protein